MTRETYLGQALRARSLRGRDYGKTEMIVNGALLGYTSRPEAEAIAQMRRDVDAALERPTAYPWLRS